MNPDFLVIDLFCGAGGTTTGFTSARIGRNKIAKVIACVNHDTFAIQSHSANHKNVLHFTEDIRTLDLGALLRHVERMCRKYPNAKVILWASLECTNFSKAKGGQPRDADSRTLAEYLFRYIKALCPDYVMIENVEEFMCWGPLDENGKPISKYEGEDFTKWVDNVKSHGFTYEHQLINCADFGAFTSRLRYFAIFGRHGLPTVWPEPTHAKNPGGRSLFDVPRRKWKAVRRVLDLLDIGRCIFDRYFSVNVAKAKKYLAPRKEKNKAKTCRLKWIVVMEATADLKNPFDNRPQKILTQGHFATFENEVKKFAEDHGITQLMFFRYDPLSEKTLQRILAGLIKFVAGGKEAFMIKYLSNSPITGVNPGADIDKPAPTVTCQNRLGIIQSFMIQRRPGNPESKVSGTDVPARTITTTGGNLNLVTAQPAFLVKFFSGQNNKGVNSGAGLDVPAPTIAASRTPASIFIASYHGNGHNMTSSDVPAPTVAAADSLAKVEAHWIDNQYGQSNATGTDRPIGTILNNPKQNFVKAQFLDVQHSQGKQNESIENPVGSLMTVPKRNLVTAKFLFNHNFTNGPRSIDEPAPTLLASRKHYYIVNPSWGGNNGSVDEPCCTVVVRQDKAPLYLTTTEEGEIAIQVYPTDSETTVKIKEFMALYGIARITMRMLKVVELKRIMGLHDDYTLIGNQSKQKWMIGNMVHPVVPMAMAKALAKAIRLQEGRKAA